MKGGTLHNKAFLQKPSGAVTSLRSLCSPAGEVALRRAEHISAAEPQFETKLITSLQELWNIFIKLVPMFAALAKFETIKHSPVYLVAFDTSWNMENIFRLTLGQI